MPRTIPPHLQLGQAIKDAREKLKMTQSELAKRAGISQPSLSAIESGETQAEQIKLVTVQKIGSALGRALDVSIFPSPNNTESVPPSRSRLPLVSWVLAGNRGEVNDPYAPGAAEAWVDFDSVASKTAYCLRVRGDSMIRPDGSGFPDGCIIAVEPARKAKSGDFVVVRFADSDTATLKQYFVEGGTKYLKPLNPAHPTIMVSPDAFLSGVVIEKRIIEKF